MKLILSLILAQMIYLPAVAVLDLTKISPKKQTRDPAQRNASYFKSLYPDQNCQWTPHPVSKAQLYDVIENTACDPDSKKQLIHGSVTCLGNLGEITYNDVYCYDKTNAFDCLSQDQIHSKKQFLPRSLKPSDNNTNSNRGIGG